MSEDTGYENPPVVEVVMGVQFTALRLFPAWLGRLDVGGLRPTQELAPLSPTIETFGNVLPLGVEVTFDESFPSPRVWFEDDTRERLVQLQRDRLLVNWRKANESCSYPRFPRVSAHFFEQLERLRSFAKSELGTPLHVQQLEMTYVNHDPLPPESDVGEAIASVVPALGWNLTASGLSRPESVHGQFSFTLPKQEGRLYVRLQNALRSEDLRPVLFLELTCRGMPSDGDERRWFETAHARIVSTFNEITSKEAQQRWRTT